MTTTVTCTLTDNGILWEETFATEAEALDYASSAWEDLAIDPETGDEDAHMLALAANTPLDASASCEDGTYRIFITTN